MVRTPKEELSLKKGKHTASTSVRDEGIAARINNSTRQAKIDGIVDLAAFSTFVNQGAPFHAVPVHIEVSCGRPYLTIEDTTLRLATWQVLIRVDFEEAQIKFGESRIVKSQKGDYETKTTSKVNLLKVEQQAAALRLGVRGRASGHRIGLGASILAMFNFAKKAQSTENEANISTLTPDITLIGMCGDKVFSIGDPDYGDPRQQYGLLSYSYPDDAGENAEPLFTLEPSGPSDRMGVTVMTTVPFDRLCLLPGDSDHYVKQFARAEINDRAREVIESYEILRQQILHDELAQRVAHNQRSAGIQNRDGEFTIMIESFLVARI